MEDKIGSPELGWWLGRQVEDSCTERGARGVGGSYLLSKHIVVQL